MGRIVDISVHARSLWILKIKVLGYRILGYYTFCRAEYWLGKWTQVMRKHKR